MSISLDRDGVPDGTVMVTGAGGPAGVAVVRALEARGRKVVGVDANPDSVGSHLAGASGTVPRAGEPGLVESLCAIAASQGAVLLVPTVAEELPDLHAGAARLSDAGVLSWVPEPGAVELCEDKLLFAAALEAAGIPTPPTARAAPGGEQAAPGEGPGGSRAQLGSARAASIPVPGPWVVKPRRGRGSRDVYLVDDPAELAIFAHRVPDALVQSRVEGREFTVDVLVGRDGVPAGTVNRWRTETKAGISTRGTTFADRELDDLVARLVQVLGITGPANVQGFSTCAGHVVLEVNPRFSGGLPLSLAAGADLVGEYLRGAAGLPLRPSRLTSKPGVTMIRYFAEVFTFT